MQERGVVFLMTMVLIIVIGMIVIPYFILTDMVKDVRKLEAVNTVQAAEIEQLNKEVRLLKQDCYLLELKADGRYSDELARERR